ncbi:ComEA family DNA-binding protein [Olsenella massiliensis]|uniref:ComEA family DNA-binding protein n=1 Tax=Olsenella massiliensis TaxID=1622075 RepID=UPI0009E73B42|nr:ComEA family DNA-binding protein [Olsenella massiliensis]
MAQLRRRRRGNLPRAVTGAVALAGALALGCLIVVGAGTQASGTLVMRDDGGPAETSQERPLHDADEGASPDVAGAPSADGDVALVVVDVDGAVNAPGVIELRGSPPRVRDAITAAGGLTEDADGTAVNLAAPLADGQKVHVPQVGEAPVAGTVASAPGFAAGSSQAAGLVNINAADEATLETLPGVGAATAATIVRDRSTNGPFATIEDLMRVSGIGEKKFVRLKDRICV